ncbi:NB-ARC domain-containing protein [uncultured Methanolobus sp.]|uniref:HD domain-containing protein n=1 Tax=uncultured Methanolobus sp. TaxID=218300 RepID=UPI002AAAD5C9|nr:NB-ARC domain-containing protein [uncultured Methanolobus sp.]
MDLRSKLDENLASKLNIIEQEAKEIWSKGELNHLYYTLHGLDHSQNVINLINKLVEGLSIELNDAEIFCLLSAAYLHDVGMQVKYDDDNSKCEGISKAKNRPYSVQDLIRDEHHIRSGRFIKDHSKTLKLDNYEADIIRLVSEGHRKTDLNSESYDDTGIGNDPMRVRLLSALLRVADELDVTYKRAPGQVYELLEKEMPSFSVLQWLKHHYTSALVITTTGNSTTINVHCHYPDVDNGNKIMNELIVKPINETIGEVQVILLRYGLDITLEQKLTINPDLDEIPADILELFFRPFSSVITELPKTKGFIGRNEELNQLSFSLDKNIIVIEGIAGIGKTYVAVKFAEKLKDDYDVYWYENLSEVSTLSSVLKKMALFLKGKGRPRMSNSLDNFGYDNDVLISLLRDELNTSKIAIFFDDYHKAEGELDPLLSQLKDIQKSKIIIVTRKKPAFYNIIDEKNNKVVIIKIDDWDIYHTEQMLKERFLTPNHDVLVKVHERLHGHPQYLNLFCILANNTDAEELLEKIPLALKDAHEYLEKEVYDSLNSEEKLLLQTISVFRIAETLDAFDSVNEFNNITVTLDSLIDNFLVDELGFNKFKVHDIIREFCMGDIGKAKTLKKYHANAAGYYLQDTENLENVLESVYHYKLAGMKEQSSRVLVGHVDNFISKGFWEKVESQLKESITFNKRKTQPNLIYLSARANMAIAELYERKGDYNECIHYANAAVSMFKKIGMHDNLLNPYMLLAAINHKKGNQEKVQYYQALCESILKSTEDKQREMAFKANSLQFADMDDDERLQSFYEVLSFFEDCDDEKKVAAVSRSISHIYRRIGEFEKSLFYLKKALKIYELRNDLFDMTVTSFDVAHTYALNINHVKNIGSLLECLNNVIQTYVQIGHLRGELEALLLKGDLLLKFNDFDLAIESYERALDIYISLNENEIYLNPRLSIGNSLTKAKKYDEAISYFLKIFEFNDITHDDFLCAKASLSELYILSKHYEQAMDNSVELIDEASDISNDLRFIYLGHFFASISSLHLNDFQKYYYHLKSIINFKSEKISIRWDFSDIKPALDDLGNEKMLIFDVVSYLKSETEYPCIRLEDVQIISESPNDSGVIFHPLVGSLALNKNDSDLQSIMFGLNEINKIDQCLPSIMEVSREKALLILGFLFQKGILECMSQSDCEFQVVLTEKGRKIKV